VTKAGPGDIVAIPKLKNTKTGNTLTAVGQTTKLPAIEFPQPVMYMALAAKTQADDDKLSTAIHRLLDCDPTLQYTKDVETKQVILKGLGDVHIDVAVNLMKSQTNVNVELSTPKVPYRETVTALGDGHYRHKKQSGGRGQFGEVYLRVFPRREGDKAEWFVDKTVGGSIPGNFMPAVLKGVHEGMLAGSVAGFPVQNINVEVYDGSYHDVDSSEMAFKIAASMGFKKGLEMCKPVLLEPIMKMEVIVPDENMGDIMGDMNSRRGKIMGVETKGSNQVVKAVVPMAEVLRYAPDLRSMTGGRGTFTMEYSHYEEVPAQIADKIVEAAKREREAQEK